MLDLGLRKGGGGTPPLQLVKQLNTPQGRTLARSSPRGLSSHANGLILLARPVFHSNFFFYIDPLTNGAPTSREGHLLGLFCIGLGKTWCTAAIVCGCGP